MEFLIYLELGFACDRHEKLFTLLLNVAGYTFEQARELIDPNAMIRKATKSDIVKILNRRSDWKKGRLPKTQIVDKIYVLCKAGVPGDYRIDAPYRSYRLVKLGEKK